MSEINPSTDAEKLIGGFITSQDYYTVNQKRRGVSARQILDGLLQRLQEVSRSFFSCLFLFALNLMTVARIQTKHEDFSLKLKPSKL